jgi:probable rRNA maturation factor
MMRPRIALAVQYTYGATAALPTRAQIRRWVGAAAQMPLQVTVRFVSPHEARQLNRDFRGRDYATNVLTFPYSAPSAKVASGDIAVCAAVIAKEAQSQKKAAHDHFAHIIMHGILHLQGYDHQGEDDAAEMEARERLLLRRFRIDDPYVQR